MAGNDVEYQQEDYSDADFTWRVPQAEQRALDALAGRRDEIYEFEQYVAVRQVIIRVHRVELEF